MASLRGAQGVCKDVNAAAVPKQALPGGACLRVSRLPTERTNSDRGNLPALSLASTQCEHGGGPSVQNGGGGGAAASGGAAKPTSLLRCCRRACSVSSPLSMLLPGGQAGWRGAGGTRLHPLGLRCRADSVALERTDAPGDRSHRDAAAALASSRPRCRRRRRLAGTEIASQLQQPLVFQHISLHSAQHCDRWHAITLHAYTPPSCCCPAPPRRPPPRRPLPLPPLPRPLLQAPTSSQTTGLAHAPASNMQH